MSTVLSKNAPKVAFIKETMMPKKMKKAEKTPFVAEEIVFGTRKARDELVKLRKAADDYSGFDNANEITDNALFALKVAIARMDEAIEDRNRG
jgi:hypothetical protein